MFESSIFCPVCSSSGGGYGTSVGLFKIYKCSCCGLEYTYPMPTDKELEEFYCSYSDVRASSEVVKINAQRLIDFIKNYGYKKDSYILDFGAGDAEFVRIAGEKCYGVDIKPSLHPRCFNSIFDSPVKEYDFLTLWGVLEHLSDPLQTLKSVVKCLKADGFLVITTVDAEGIIPYYYKPVEHLTYWTKRSFEIFLEKLGMEIVYYKPYFMIQRSEVYIDRLISRTPEQYHSAFLNVPGLLPAYVEVPTNEILVVAKFS